MWIPCYELQNFQEEKKKEGGGSKVAEYRCYQETLPVKFCVTSLAVILLSFQMNC